MAKDDNHLSEQYITFTIGEEDYAISIINVEEIVKVTNLIKVPKSQTYFVGLMDIRGKVVNMIDLSKKIMNKKVGESAMNRAIIVKIDGKSLGARGGERNGEGGDEVGGLHGGFLGFSGLVDLSLLVALSAPTTK